MPKTSELRGKVRAIESEARERIESITDDTPASRAAEIEREVDELLAQRDRVAAEIEERQDAVLDGAADNGDPRRPSGGEAAVRGNGQPADNGDGEPTYALRSDQRFTDYVRDRSGSEFRELGTGDYLRAMVLGAKSDLEKRALAEGSDSAGGYTTPEFLSARMIDNLRAASVVFRAGAQTVPLTSDVNHIAKVASDPTPGWRAENATVDEDDPTFSRVTFTPQTLAVVVRASRELLEDTLNLNTVLPTLLATALAKEVDRAAMFGSGSGNEPQGVVNFAAAQEVEHNGALDSYAPLVSARTRIMSANSPGAPTGYVMHPDDEGTLIGLTASDGQPLQAPAAVSAIPFLPTTAVPVESGTPDTTQMIAGYWPSLMVGMRSNIRVEVLRERFADNYQYGFLAVLRADVAAEHENLFCKITGIEQS